MFILISINTANAGQGVRFAGTGSFQGFFPEGGFHCGDTVFPLFFANDDVAQNVTVTLTVWPNYYYRSSLPLMEPVVFGPMNFSIPHTFEGGRQANIPRDCYLVNFPITIADWPSGSYTFAVKAILEDGSVLSKGDIGVIWDVNCG